MKLLLAVAVILAVLGVRYFVSRINTPTAKPRAKSGAGSANPHVAMREHVLAATAAEFGLSPLSRGVWGVLMELGSPEGWATVVALSDGSASLYTSAGGGVIGGRSHERVAEAARDFCAAANELAGGLQVATTFPPPTSGRIVFHVLTVDGVRSIDEAESRLRSGSSRLTPLYHGGHDVITELRSVAPAPGGG
jgi:hypothetical protein